MADWTGAGRGAISGATAGATIGSAIPGVGTAIGGGIGGLLGGTLGLFGKKAKKKKLSSLDKKQSELNQQQYQSILGKGPLADLYNYDPEQANAVFDKTIANPAYKNFEENLAPSVTGQFRSQGLMNSSYAGDALTKIARDIQQNLDTQRSQYLYGQQKDSQTAKQNAVENLQNRQTFGYDRAAGTSGFDINRILESLTPDAQQQLKTAFKS